MRLSVEILSESVASARGVFRRGQLVEGKENDLRPLVDAGMAKWANGPGGEPALNVDGTLWGLNAEDAIRTVQDADDAALLRLWHTGETRNPRYRPNGRKTVTDAIEERLGELRIANEAEEE